MEYSNNVPTVFSFVNYVQFINFIMSNMPLELFSIEIKRGDLETMND